uniref:UDP-glucuronosyltransferase n=1 Tax=Sinocyclocheilus grahami TaxID=75366 RepID=A0A672QS48_SINGR
NAMSFALYKSVCQCVNVACKWEVSCMVNLSFMRSKQLSSLTCLLFVTCCCHGGNILVWPEDGSHWLNMKVILRKLHSYSHSLTVVRSSKSWYIKENSSLYSTITVNSVETEDVGPDYFKMLIERSLALQRMSSFFRFLEQQKDIANILKVFHNGALRMVSAIFDDAALVERLREAKFDLLLTDPAFPASVLLANSSTFPWFTMYLLERHFPPGTNLLTMQQSADIWLMRMDFVFEFPWPTMLNVVYMGGFQCQPAQALPTELEEFMQSSGKHGVVIMSLGAVVSALPTAITEAIATAFAEIPQKVLWRYHGERPSTLGKNTLLLEWFPQNDLLGHPKTCVFVSHGGTNGIYEAIYHGVPVLALPLLFDQFDNVLQLQVRGAARVLKVATLTSQEFLEALKDVLENPLYRSSIRKLSELHHDRPLSPLDRAAHLHSEGNNLPWYSYHNIDVLAFLLTFTVIALLTLAYVCKLLCCRKSIKKRKVE